MTTKEAYMPNSCPYCGDSGIHYVYVKTATALDIFYNPYIIDIECGKCHRTFKKQYKLVYDKTIYEVKNG